MFPFLSGLVCGLALAQSVHAVVIDEEVNDMFTLNDFQIAAKNALSPADYAQYRTGTLDETSMKSLEKV
jgi:hypothetical protein